MPMEPRTSFVIASRDRASELAATVERLLDTTACPIAVVDNASRDDSVAVIGRLSARSGGRLKLITLSDNLGAIGRNVGVAHCQTPFVAFCDDDSWWDPDAPTIAETVFDRHPTVALLAARTVVWPSKRDDPMAAALADSPLGHDPALPGPSILGFLACSAVVRKDAFDAVGGFSAILHFRGEEQLLAWDLAANGWDLCFCPALLAYHHPSAIRPTNSVQDARNLRNAALTAWLRRPVRRCVAMGAELARAAAGDVAHAKALGEAVRLLPKVLRERRRLPANVEAAVAKLERG
jgi:GT2 family glycosyltransferase